MSGGTSFSNKGSETDLSVGGFTQEKLLAPLTVFYNFRFDYYFGAEIWCFTILETGVKGYLLKVVIRDHAQQMFDEIIDRIEKVSQPQILRNKLKNLQKNIHDGEINWIGKQMQQLELKGVTLERTLSRSQGLKSRF
ncbi:hypothetical protein WN944_013706 [Citrus x changshan-huyou]|uniref:Uncharacterized protein n=1 Tax=Citrus x changshan-huyou TaxID=2935761 RepID=A0AAP0M8L5_9ROSI